MSNSQSLDQEVELELGGAGSGAMLEDDLNTKEYYPEENRGRDFMKKILTAETGAGSVGDYLDHPMNVLNNNAGARILRGLTGIFGNLDLAIIDIAVGVLDLLKGRKKNDVSGGGYYPS